MVIKIALFNYSLVICVTQIMLATQPDRSTPTHSCAQTFGNRYTLFGSYNKKNLPNESQFRFLRIATKNLIAVW